MLDKSYPSKVLILGEYTILNGSRALAIPYPGLYGKWSYENSAGVEKKISQASLKKFVEHSHPDFINSQKLRADLDKGLWFDSTIPHGYGLGSSGALIAAIYDAYGIKSHGLIKDKKILARLEDHFHGSSSGLDPLVSYLQQALLIHSFDKIEVLKRLPILDGFFLVNTGGPRQTGPLVEIYKEKLKDLTFRQECANVLQRDVDFAIDAMIRNDRHHLQHHLWHISKFQWDYFSEMIPANVHKLWTRGLETGDYILKLCGAGGGGFLLGHKSEQKSRQSSEHFCDFEIKELS